MRSYVETCKGICGYNLVYKIFGIPFALDKCSFCGALFSGSVVHFSNVF